MRRATSVLSYRFASGQQSCSASTAAKPKPLIDFSDPPSSSATSRWAPPQSFVQRDSPDEKASRLSPNLSKWVRPQSVGDSQPEGRSGVASGLGKWARPAPGTASPPSTSRSGVSLPDGWSRNATHRKTAPVERNLDRPASERTGTLDPIKSSLLTRQSAIRHSRDTNGGLDPFQSSGTTQQSPRASPPHLDRDPAPHRAPSLVPQQGQTQSRGSQTPRRTPTEDDVILKPIEEEGVVEEGHVRDRREVRSVRGSHKSRGSLLAHLTDEDAAIPSHSKHGTHQPGTDLVKKKKKKDGVSKVATKKVAVDLFVPSVVSVGTLARLLNIRLGTLQRKMVEAGMAAEATPDHILTSEYASLLVMEFGRNPVVNDEAAFDIYPSPPHAESDKLPLRPPVVTIMGHVDHGKTTLLDTLRSSSVAKGEAGGITQHIGAFSVPVGPTKNTVTFLDTPGHAAFSAMRARGVMVTDIIVLVVAADDGVMPQTREIIELIKKEGDNIGVVVAINKVDKPGVDIEKVTNMLVAEGLQLETVGGDIPVVPVSGLTGKGLDDLVETISAVAELQNLRAECESNIHGYVLESKIQKGLGPIATVLVLRGTLTPGIHLISGQAHAKVRVLQSPSGASVKSATPGTAVVVSGWKELPAAGDDVLSGSEDDVKKALANRIRKAEIESSLIDLEAINEQRKQEREHRDLEDTGVDVAEVQDGLRLLRLIVKADVSGSVEAVVGAVSGIGNEKASVKVVASGVGDVTESDVMRAKAVEGMVVAFSVKIPRPIEVIAAQNEVPLYSATIIYRLLDDVKNRLVALLPVTIETKVTGEATVLQVFDIQVKSKKVQKVAGCRVAEGVIEKGKKARVLRNGEVIAESALETLRVLSKDVQEVRKGSECGLGLQGFEDIRQGDVIQVCHEVELPGEL
ncbi:initiation factor 2 [Neolentinus lepideus HHB14362 ss-1]|uniref:Translation initiation factor IF-2, mitochondrial n=1 Tax=Neolentinus lepideus HHB14362 ss-1 TaxID=1314782 RepID=A0A165UPH9_9AGAM|nr:initiation factor 2 [Neolentinus lepideus HHB14362 ss-1]